MWFKETGSEESAQLISLLISQWHRGVLSSSGSAVEAFRGQLVVACSQRERGPDSAGWTFSETSKPRNLGCHPLFLRTWQANWSVCKHGPCMSSNTEIPWGKWGTETPWECVAELFQCTSQIQFYFTAALVVIYQLVFCFIWKYWLCNWFLAWQQHTSLFLSPRCRSIAHPHGLGALTVLGIAGALLGRA